MMTLQGICGGYHGTPVLRDISLSVDAGDFIALLGPNGSGKSTLLKLMAGQMLPRAGSIRLDSRRLTDFTPKQRSRRVAYFPQVRPIPNMDVYTLVSHGRFPRLGFGHVMGEADRRAVEDAMTQTGLTELADRPLASLSGGERQRAYLAMLIAQEADLLLLDEPGSFLDIQHQLEVMEVLKRLNEQGKTIVLAAHDLPLSFTYAGRILLLCGGVLMGDASPERMADSRSLQQAFGVGLKPLDCGLFRYTLVHAEDADG